MPAFTPFVPDMSPYRSGAVFFAWGLLLAVFSQPPTGRWSLNRRTRPL